MPTEELDAEISDEDWRVIVENVPIVSVDLVVRRDDGILLGKRENAPAKGEWFVPGGTVHKHERLRDAVHRVAVDELGTDVDIERRLGTYQHFYETADVESADGKHYLATAFVVRPTTDRLEADDQHATFRYFSPPFEELHPYVERYLDEIDVLGREPTSPDDGDYR